MESIAGCSALVSDAQAALATSNGQSAPSPTRVIALESRNPRLVLGPSQGADSWTKHWVAPFSCTYASAAASSSLLGVTITAEGSYLSTGDAYSRVFGTHRIQSDFLSLSQKTSPRRPHSDTESRCPYVTLCFQPISAISARDDRI